MSVREVPQRNKSKWSVKCRPTSRDASQIFSHADVFNDGEYRFARPDDDESVSNIESLDIVTGVENDGCRARGASPALAFPQDEASQAATLGLRIDRHETNLGFRGSVEMQATDGESARIRADDHEMLAFRFAIIFLGAAGLIPRRAQNTPPQIEIILPFGRSSRRARRFGDVFGHPCDYPYEETDGEVNL